MFDNICRKLLGRKLWGKWTKRQKMRRTLASVKPYFEYDMVRLIKYSGAFGEETIGKLQSRIMILYHVIEKGLTMPNRKLWFGRDALMVLVDSINRFEKRFGRENQQVRHAVGVVKNYHSMHLKCGVAVPPEMDKCWAKVNELVNVHEDVPVSEQLHFKKEEFYGKKGGSFFEFAHARRTIRNYAPVELPVQRIRDAVTLALTTPSACNRQYCRVHCVTDKSTIGELLAIQGGCRGFGQLADKLLVVTSDLEGVNAAKERDDLFTNGGMFLMNLSYSLFYYEVAHCILNWSRTPEEDMAMRKLLKIRDSETVVAVLSCGVAPDEFDVASSPRKSLSEVLVLQ